MPRGFLVKRSKRASGGSYRIRHAGTELQTSDSHALRSETPREPFRTPSAAATAARAMHVHPPELSAHAPARSVFYSGVLPDNDDEEHGAEEDWVRPARPLSRSAFSRCVTSPAAAESFPVSSIEQLLLSSHARMKFSAYPLSFQQNRKLERKSAPPARKPKLSRKLAFQDEVTSSPVLGLRIKKESPERARVASSRKPLGEFICQLCREQYPDPLSLAQHRCSRIVRVEYRCPECDKVFSCPANLASHRRWHKPREALNSKNTPTHDTQSVEGKENASEQHLHPAPPPPPQLLFFATESTQSGMTSADLRSSSSDDGSRMYERRRDDTDSLAPGYLCARAGGEEEYTCHYCAKKFRRHAYLKKHLAAHQSVHAAAYKHAESAPIPFTCHLCGARFPSAEVREKHRLWHALAGSAKTPSALLRADFILPPKPNRMWEIPS